MNPKKPSRNWRTILALIWCLFTLSLTGWWWLWFLKNTELLARTHRMFLWEGSILMGSLLMGGIFLIFFSFKDQERHERLRLFFANFSHDIKTSITRLRLQSEVLAEGTNGSSAASAATLQRLIQDIHRLDLQLENSLQFANQDSRLLLEPVSLSSVIVNLRDDFADLSIELEKDVKVLADRKALTSVIRNLLQNSLMHGKATEMKIGVSLQNQDVEILFKDNGSGFSGDLKNMGKQIQSRSESLGNGMGLFISENLLSRMRGSAEFVSDTQGSFIVKVRLNKASEPSLQKSGGSYGQ